MAPQNDDVASFLRFGLLAAVLTVGIGVAQERFENPPLRPERKIVFVQGINSEDSCVLPNHRTEGFGALWSMISTELELTEDDLYAFSYSDVYCHRSEKRRARYEPEDTCSSIDMPRGSSERFSEWFNEIRRTSGPRATFDIIAHSMGGVIVLYWASQENTLDGVRSIVTLDSPLQGRRLSWVPGGFLPVCRGQPAADDLRRGSRTIVLLNEPSKPRSCSSRQLAEETATVTKQARILTIRNTADRIVPATDACIEGAKVDVKITDACSLFSHDCVFRNEKVHKALDKWLEFKD